VVYFFWPETARLSLEEVAKNFGDEVAVHVNDASEEEKLQLEKALENVDVTKMNETRQKTTEVEP
jgi:(p)ppGpp synthase/HD superfamily hydrolase